MGRFPVSISTDVAWAAGLFEGEGCLYEVRGQALPHLSITIEMADEDVISRFFAVLVAHGVKTRSRVTTRWRGNAKHSRVYAVKMTGKSAEAAYALMRPYLGKGRRCRGDEILARRRAAEAEAHQVGTCLGCGQEFGVPLMARRKQWCSSECYHRVKARSERGRELARERNRRYRSRLRAIGGTAPGSVAA